jgi:hypothetical protein
MVPQPISTLIGDSFGLTPSIDPAVEFEHSVRIGARKTPHALRGWPPASPQSVDSSFQWATTGKVAIRQGAEQETEEAVEAESIVIASLSSMRREAEEALRRYASYPEGWDGYDGVPFSGEALERAHATVHSILTHFASRLKMPDEIQTGPSGDGSIDIDTSFRGRRLFVTVYPGDEGLHVSIQTGGETRSEVADFGENTLGRWLSRLTLPLDLSLPVLEASGPA